MVQAPVARLVEGARTLAGETAHLLGREAPRLQQVRQRHRAGERLLDDEGDPLVGADVEHAHEPRVLDARGTTGGVERGGSHGGRGPEADEGDLALEREVVGTPALVGGGLRRAEGDGIPPPEKRSGSDPLHVRHPSLVSRPALPSGVSVILG